MGTSVYMYSYPKDAVSKRVQQAWNQNKPISHLDYVYEEVEGKAEVLEWSAKYGFCMEALRLLAPNNQSGEHDGDQEFSLRRDQLIKFKADIESLDITPERDDEWSRRSLNELQRLIDTFDFDTKYLTVYTD